MEDTDWGWLIVSVGTNMADQVKLLPYLPVEVVVQILCCEQVSHVDICRLSLTCQRMREICYTEKIWRCKYKQRCVHVFFGGGLFFGFVLFFRFLTHVLWLVPESRKSLKKNFTVIFLYYDRPKSHDNNDNHKNCMYFDRA